ncbi:MAG: DNA methyltransferase [Methanoregula sp.]|jgi:DNA modification methylase
MKSISNPNQSLGHFLGDSIPEKVTPPINGNNHSSFSDPAFASNKTQPIHRWVPWIAGFSKEFVNDSIKRYIDGTGTIMDPFAGVGTTLVESHITGNDSIGFEINPYAYFACKTKINSLQINEGKFNEEIERFSAFYLKNLNSKYKVRSKVPDGFKTKIEFYSPKVLHKVLILMDFIETIEDQTIADLFKLAFTSTMVKYSNYSYEPSLGTRRGSGKADIEDYDVSAVTIQKLLEFLRDIAWIKKTVSNQRVPTSRIINDSFFNYKDHLMKKTVDLIITSPPYLNNYHYNRNTRPQIFWLGFANGPADLKPLEENNFGNFWQTVRGREKIDPIFNVPDIDLIEKIEQIRKINPEKGVYGGSGWANYAMSYFNDCYKFSKGIDYTLKKGGTALVVIGNSILQGVTIPTDEYFAKIAETVGLETVEIHIPRSKRIGNSIIHSNVRITKPTKGHQLYEAIVELKKS